MTLPAWRGKWTLGAAVVTTFKSAIPTKSARILGASNPASEDTRAGVAGHRRLKNGYPRTQERQGTRELDRGRWSFGVQTRRIAIRRGKARTATC
eukprot:scaffold2389_cov262-Pinguiococcus_pyrenoidosus.AAC.4